MPYTPSVALIVRRDTDGIDTALTHSFFAENGRAVCNHVVKDEYAVIATASEPRPTCPECRAAYDREMAGW